MSRRIPEEVRIMGALRELSPEKREVVLNLALAEFTTAVRAKDLKSNVEALKKAATRLRHVRERKAKEDPPAQA